MSENKALTPRELEVLQLVSSGASNRRIAQELQVSSNTVKVHLRNIMTKLGAESRTQAVMIGMQEGLITPPVESASPAPTSESSWRTLVGSPLIIALIALLGVLIISLGVYSGWALSQQGNRAAALAVEDERWDHHAPLSAGRAAIALAALDGAIYAIGGQSEAGVTSLVERYDPGSDSWLRLAEKPTPVRDAGAVALGGRIYVAGGEDTAGGVTDLVEVYDPIEDAWEHAAPLPEARSAYAAAEYEGRLYLFGGWDGSAFVDTTFIYDPAADAWERGQPLPEALGHAGAVAIDAGVLVTGGTDGGHYTDAAWLYTPSLEERGLSAWQEVASLPERLTNVSLANFGGFVYAVGNTDGESPPSMFIYLPPEDAWKANAISGAETYAEVQGIGLAQKLYFVGGWSQAAYSGDVRSYQAVYTVVIPFVQ
jgi:DNA-binding CsgD family transcriptional regulator/N-acetylneuraminic acid mutarotase